MSRSADQLRRDVLAIWQAGLDAVAAEKLVADALRVEGDELFVEEEPLGLARIERIAVVGGGKAGAGMAAAVEHVLGPELLSAKRVEGWVHVPADCVRPLSKIHLHAARPAGRNEPTPAGVEGTEHILNLVGKLGANDLCLVLISGGASALLPAPIEGISLDDKLAVTRHLSAAGANIEELNTVRTALSRIKGGGLARACRAGRIVTLIISDVPGDPLPIIGSGPTVLNHTNPEVALQILDRYDARGAGIAAQVFRVLEASRAEPAPSRATHGEITHHVIGNNALAVDAAGQEAERRGYSHAMTSARDPEGPAEDVGRHLATLARRMRTQAGPDCLISGGEPVVRLAPAERRGLGGRNQQLALAALDELRVERCQGVALLSGGTDGEDGPTDAAGALVDAEIVAAVHARHLDPADYLQRNDAYHFFEPLGGLLKTGPTHTNVCDLRVVVVDRVETATR